MHRCGISLFRDRVGLWLAFILILMMASFMIHAFARLALAQVPLEGQSGVIERSLRQSLPQELPPEERGHGCGGGLAGLLGSMTFPRETVTWPPAGGPA